MRFLKCIHNVYESFCRGKNILLLQAGKDYLRLALTDSVEKGILPLGSVAVSDGDYAAENVLDALMDYVPEELEDGCSVIYILADGLAYEERVKLPSMGRKDLRKVLKWEALHCLAWEEGSYTYDGVSVEIPEAGDGTTGNVSAGEVQLIAVKLDLLTQLFKIGESLAFKTYGVTTALGSSESELMPEKGKYNSEEFELLCSEYAPSAWVAQQLHGNMTMPDLLPETDRKTACRNRIFRASFAACSCLNLLLGIVYGGFFLHDLSLQERLSELEKKAVELESWEEKMVLRQKTEQEVEKLTALLRENGTSSALAGELACWGMSVGGSCRMKGAERRDGEKYTILWGVGDNIESVNNFAAALLEHGLYGKAELLDTKLDEETKLSYRIKVYNAEQSAGNRE